MDFQQFVASLQDELPPQGLSEVLTAMWEEKRGKWEKAHLLVQDEEGGDGAWIHAYLHRKEGDHWNANYWYRRAGKVMPELSLEEEWESIVRALLEKHRS